MNCLKGIAVAACFVAAVAFLVPAVKAEDANWLTDVNWSTAVYFSGPVQIGRDVFPAGSYVFQRRTDEVTAQMMGIYSVDRGRWEGLIMGVPARRSTDVGESVVTFEKRNEGEPDALRYWFFAGSNIGMEFPTHGKATQTAKNGGTLVTVVAQSASR